MAAEMFIIFILLTLSGSTNCDKNIQVNSNLQIAKYIWPLKTVVQDVLNNVTVTMKDQLTISCVDSLIQFNNDLRRNKIYSLKSKFTVLYIAFWSDFPSQCLIQWVKCHRDS